MGLDGEQHAAVERTRSRSGATSSLLTPRVDAGQQGLVVRAGSGDPSVVTPSARAADRRAASTSSPGCAVELGALPDDGHARVARRQASHARPRRAPARRAASTLARKWSSRPPWPPTTTIARDARSRARRRSASSRSVASLSVGWRSTRAPAASAAARTSGSTESRSPTTRSTRDAERVRVLEPGVGGDHERRRRAARRGGARRRGSPPANTSARAGLVP